jgi:hypothetical protein
VISTGGWCAPSSDVFGGRVGVEFLQRRSLLVLARQSGLRRYSRLRRGELVEALQAAGVRDIEVAEPEVPSLPQVSINRGGVVFPLARPAGWSK